MNTKRFLCLGLACLAALPPLRMVAASPSSIVQLGIILDASSSTDSEELPLFVQGVASGIESLKADGSIELTITQFRSAALVIFGPTLIDSEAVRQQAADRVLALNPNDSVEPPFTSGTDIEEGFLVTKQAMQNSPNAGTASLQFVNMLTDGNPTLHQHLTLEDLNETTRRQRARTFAKAERDQLIAVGIDVISFEALGSRPEDIDYLKTLAFPEPAVVVSAGSTDFPDPITSNGFIVEIATIQGIAAALIAKFEAAGFAAGEPPEPLLRFKESTFDPQSNAITLEWFAEPGATYQVEYTSDFASWKDDLPNSRFTAAPGVETLTFSEPLGTQDSRFYRVRRVTE